MRVLIRGIGPALRQFGVENYHYNPTLNLFRHENGDATQIDQAATWFWVDPAIQNQVGAFALTGSETVGDTMLVRYLDPGVYSVLIYPVGASSPRVALIEIYEVP